MRLSILLHGLVGLLVLLALDRLWPILPVHVLAGFGCLMVVVLMGLALVAAGRR